MLGITTKLIVSILLLIGGTKSASNAVPLGNACSLLTQDQVSAAVGVTMDSGAPLEKIRGCMWTQIKPPKKQQRYHVLLVLKTVDEYEEGKKAYDILDMTLTPVGGIGDEAYYTTIGAFSTLSVKKGGEAFAIGVQVPADRQKATEKVLALQILLKVSAN